MGSNENEKPMLILKDIHKFYGTNEVLKGVSLEVRKGELVTFVGPSGCGKTTLLRLIGGFTDISSGDIISRSSWTRAAIFSLGHLLIFNP